MNLGLIKYFMLNYGRSGKYLFPLLLYFAWQVTAYQFQPVEFLEILGFTSLVNFVCMTIIGITFMNHRSPMIEMSFLARLQNKQQFYHSKVFALFDFSFTLALIGVFFPILLHVARGFTLFQRPLTFADIAGAFFVLFLSSLCGAFAGLLFNNRFIKKRELQLLLCIAWGMIALFRGSIILEVDWLKFVLWLFPPVHELARRLMEMDSFELASIWLYFLYAILYCIVLTIGYVKIMKVKGVE